MTRPISTYHLLQFEPAAKAQDAHHRITQLLVTSSGVPYLKDDPAKRAVILAGPPTTLYLSPGALEIAETLWINLPTSKVVHPSDLPKGLKLLIGEPSDLPQ